MAHVCEVPDSLEPAYLRLIFNPSTPERWTSLDPVLQCAAHGEMAEWFKAAVLTRRQDAVANIGEADGPEGVEGRMPGIKLP